MTTKIKSASLNNNIITTGHLHTNFSLDSDKIADDAVTDDKINLTGTGALQLPDGTTAQRPGSPTAGQLRFNTSKFSMEVYDGDNWVLSSTVPSYTADFLVIAGGGGGGYSPAGTWRGGLSISITGSAVTYAAGGGGYWSNVQQSGNNGNGGAGKANGAGNGENGNPGVVIIRYSGSQRATGGTVTTTGSDTVHTFTSNGNFVA